MITVLTRSAIHWMEAHRRRAAAQRRRAETRALLEQGDATFADIGLGRSALERALDVPDFHSALDVAYRDSARLSATYAVH